ncbi:MAG TPA: hypothetical protein VK171_07845 [Fimbriimonas sp.]|nr:hypothetical protein [Fimbriimonas sp.]
MQYFEPEGVHLFEPDLNLDCVKKWASWKIFALGSVPERVWIQIGVWVESSLHVPDNSSRMGVVRSSTPYFTSWQAGFTEVARLAVIGRAKVLS